MGGILTNNQKSAQVEESSEDEDFLPASLDIMEAFRYSTDAVDTGRKISLPVTRKLTCSDALDLERDLDFNEKVSLVFLLYDDPDVALQTIEDLEKNLPVKVLEKLWVIHQSWNTKVLEGLAIVQNYKNLNKFGYTLDEIHLQFLPLRDSSIEIDLAKKKLYRICENLTSKQFQNLLDLVQAEFATKKIEFKTFTSNLLELYLLDWMAKKYISVKNYINLAKIFKEMGMLDLADYLRSVSSETHRQIRRMDLDDVDEMRLSVCSSSGTFLSEHRHNLMPVYAMDKDTPGICLIINQELFYTEPDIKLKHLIPYTDRMLETRRGTEFDCERIKRTMGSFGYKVIVEDNLDHYSILETLEKVVKEVKADDCSLFVYILSHGIQGKIFGSNSIPVEVSKLKRIMSETNVKNLSGKPKILIIQACQGIECETVPIEQYDIEMDSPSAPTKPWPQSANMFVFWATVPGYGAIRDRKNGTWFVQSLCQQMEEYFEEYHFEEICTMVVKDVTSKRWGIKTMTPIKESTLTASLYFPRVSTDIRV